MAVEAEGLRVFQKVNIKIGEAKNIIPYPGPTRMRDCYCTINLDQEEVFRTKVIEKSLCPFYGEEFFCEIPRSFRQLSFYIFDRDVFKRDSSIVMKMSVCPAGDQDVQYTAVSSFIYLRFFAAAVLTPSLFQLRPHYPDPSTSRTLTLISKTIQTLGSLSKSKSGSVKESYMAAFYDHFSEEEYTAAVKDFLDLISSSQRWDQNVIETPVTLKEGFMRKRAWGRKCCGLKSFQKKWFRLTNHEFIYRKNKGSGMLHRIPVENILAVERLEEESFNKKNMFQVIQPERTLYIQATNCVEARDWINILTKVSQSNRQRLSTYHPLAFLDDLWPCCGLAADSAPGCTPCTGVLPDNIELDIDGDRETERIFCLFSRYMDRLEKMQEACGSKAVYHGLELNDDFIIDDPQETYKTLKQIMAFVRLLKLEHAQYKREKFRKTRYGSEEYPIGDSNFQCFITQLSENSAHGI
nr:ras GTPase-activating protein 3-like [Paramormyrops kingsleyae]